MRNSERGSAAIYFSFALLLSIAVGAGAYIVLRDHYRAERAAAAAEALRPKPAPAPKHVTPSAAVVEEKPPEAVEEAQPEITIKPPPEELERAAADALDPSETGGAMEVRFGTPGTSGNIDKGTIIRRVERERVKLTKCMLKNNSFGLVKIALEVDAGGKLASIDDRMDQVNDGMRACIYDVFSRITTPLPSNQRTAWIVYPIEFVGEI